MIIFKQFPCGNGFLIPLCEENTGDIHMLSFFIDC